MNTKKSKSSSNAQNKGLESPGQTLSCLPWQHEEYDRIRHQQASGKLSHALLVSGQAFLGKSHFAHAIVSAMLCERAESMSNDSALGRSACGECTGCHLLAAGTHPDFRSLRPEDSKLIKIEQIRDVIAWVSQTAQRSGKKVVIVNPADQMNHQSANALLKCLEEPAGDSLIMLVTSHPGRLLPTIRSRCQLVDFHIPSRSKAIEWLQQYGADSGRDNEILLDVAGGAPLAVLERFDEAFLERRKVIILAMTDLISGKKTTQQVSELLSKSGAADAIDCLYDLSIDCLKYLSCSDIQYIRNRDMSRVIEEICGAYDIDAMFKFCETLKVSRQELSSSSNPDAVLLVESVVIALKSLPQRAVR